MSQFRTRVATAPLTARPNAPLPARFRSTTRRLSAAMLLIALAACQSGEESGQTGAQPGEQRKNPFATGNVSVAPQIEGRPSAPTPIPAPRPTLEP